MNSKKIFVQDEKENIEIKTIKVSFPFYAKEVSRYTSEQLESEEKIGSGDEEKTVRTYIKIRSVEYLKFYDEFTYASVKIEKREKPHLEFYPSFNNMSELSGEINYEQNFGLKLYEILNQEKQYELSTQEEFEGAMKKYWDYIDELMTYAPEPEIECGIISDIEGDSIDASEK